MARRTVVTSRAAYDALRPASRAAYDRALDAKSRGVRDNLTPAEAARQAGTRVATLRKYGLVELDPLGRLDFPGRVEHQAGRAPKDDRFLRVVNVPTSRGDVTATVRGSRAARDLSGLQRAIKVLGDPTALSGDRTDALDLIRDMRGRSFGGIVFDMTPEQVLDALARGVLKLTDLYPERAAA